MDVRVIDEQERKELLEEHPVIKKGYFVVTPVVAKVYALIRDRVNMRTTGAFLYATPRMGKTICAKIVQILLQAEYPKILVIRFISEPSKQQSAMLQDILAAEMLAIPHLPRYKDLQRQLLTHIQSSLSMREGDQFVLIVDEMQNLSEENLIDLATIHNRLESLGIRMTTVGFAQPEIMNRRTALLATDKTFLIARFLSEPIPFSGCASIDDLRAILIDYDLKLHYPEDGDCTFTRFFLYSAYDNGFRLADYAKAIWRELMSAAKGLATETIPMEHLSRTVEFLLVSGRHLDGRDFELTPKAIKAAVAASNLRYFSGLMASPPAE